MKTIFAIATLIALLPGSTAARTEVDEISEIVVTSQRRAQSKHMHPLNITQLGSDLLTQVQHQHIHELLNRVAGVWVVRGSGQDHQTAMRSPVLGGAGACGGFLILEDSIPIRPASFCNINQLIEVNAEQARSVEVIRGPGNALFGSNAMHGIVNVLMPTPADKGIANAGLELGANDFFRVRATLPFTATANWLAAATYTSDGGFRDDSGYTQSKLHLKRDWLAESGDLTLAFSAADLRQDSAGFITGEDAYEDRELSVSNPNPEAYKDVSSMRLYAIWTRSLAKAELDVRPYLRYSNMDFMHHAMPGQPIEENGQTSAGIVSALTFEGVATRTVAGIDIEWSELFLQQRQTEPTSGSPSNTSRGLAL